MSLCITKPFERIETTKSNSLRTISGLETRIVIYSHLVKCGLRYVFVLQNNHINNKKTGAAIGERLCPAGGCTPFSRRSRRRSISRLLLCWWWVPFEMSSIVGVAIEAWFEGDCREITGHKKDPGLFQITAQKKIEVEP